MATQLKDTEFDRKLRELAGKPMTREEKNAQRVSFIMSGADPSDNERRKKVEAMIEEKYGTKEHDSI